MAKLASLCASANLQAREQQHPGARETLHSSVRLEKCCVQLADRNTGCLGSTPHRLLARSRMSLRGDRGPKTDGAAPLTV